jgi:SPOR domain
MADHRYQDRPFPADDHYDRGGDPSAMKAESDPLAELARLIGQTDPFAPAPKAEVQPQPRHPLQSRANARPQTYQPPARQENPPARQESLDLPPGPPSWMQRRQEVTPPVEYEQQDVQPRPVHPLHRYAAQQGAAPAPEYRDELAPEEAAQEPDRSRYDDALYGQVESGEQDFQHEPAYSDDPYGYQYDPYEEEGTWARKRPNGLMTVFAVLALAVLGTGAAFAYRTYLGSPRSGEPPIIKADNSPTKIVPAQPDGATKLPDRMALGDATEKLVSREETPVDLNAKAGPRVVFPQLNPNASPPAISSVAPSAPPPMAAATGTLPNSEPRKVKTLSVKGDAADAGVPASAPPPAKPASVARPAGSHSNPALANASATVPLSLAPSAQPDPPPTGAASTSPAPAASGGYMVQVSSQKNEAEAQASYRVLQSKFPSVLGSHSPIIKRADLGEKGVYYRAMVGPFGTSDEAAQLCGSLKNAGGKCVVQRN